MLSLSAVGVQAGPDEWQACPESVTPSQVLRRLNELRQQQVNCGDDLPRGEAPALRWSDSLASSSASYAGELADRDTLSHVDREGEPFDQRLRKLGYAFRYAGENLAAGQRSLDEAISAWLGSPGHCANLMNERFSEVGLACARRAGSRYDTFWVVQLGAPRDSDAYRLAAAPIMPPPRQISFLYSTAD